MSMTFFLGLPEFIDSLLAIFTLAINLVCYYEPSLF